MISNHTKFHMPISIGLLVIVMKLETKYNFSMAPMLFYCLHESGIHLNGIFLKDLFTPNFAGPYIKWCKYHSNQFAQ
jgi:hypothetical protein